MRRTIFERDLGRAVARFYGRYHLVTADQLRGIGRFTVVTRSAEEDELRRLLPGCRLTAIGVDEYSAESPRGPTRRSASDGLPTRRIRTARQCSMPVDALHVTSTIDRCRRRARPGPAV
jgi:hypothetical protein